MARVLVVDDEENLRLVLRTLLRRAGYEVRAVASAEARSRELPAFDPTSCSPTCACPGMSGIELCRELAARGSPATVIVMSAYGSVDLALEAMKAGAYDYVAKPFKPDEVLLVLRKAEEREALRRENRALRAEPCASSTSSASCSARASRCSACSAPWRRSPTTRPPC